MPLCARFYACQIHWVALEVGPRGLCPLCKDGDSDSQHGHIHSHLPDRQLSTHCVPSPALDPRLERVVDKDE